MQVINNIIEIKKFVKQAKLNNKTIALVPTMGFLHQGHTSLIQKAKEYAEIVIVSIFVNPLQFNVQSDLVNYPRDFDKDTKLCLSFGVDIIFNPSIDEIYPNGKTNSIVNMNFLDQNLCGRTRPGHFTGVCTIVAKLFNIISPDIACFGKKDIQQFRIIETMVDELSFDIKIIGSETIRDVDGLALSSRNSNLSKDERAISLIVPQLLMYVLDLIKSGLYDVKNLLYKAKEYLEHKTLNNEKIKLDYIEIVNYKNLQLLENVQGRFIIATAIFIGKTRLIDNLIYEI